jgi:very-short-patch-repair endonuclease
MAIARAVIDVAAGQGGYIKRSQLLELGASESSVGRMVGRGDLTPVASGVYRVLDARDHVDLLTGAILTLPDAVASHQSAAALHRFPLQPALVPTVTVHSRTTHVFPGVTVRRSADLKRRHLVAVGAIRTTNVTRTVFDLAAVLEVGELDSIAEALVIGGRLQLTSLEALINDLARKGKPGIGKLRDLIERRGGAQRIDSTMLEREGGALLTRAVITGYVTEHPTPWDRRSRFDLAFETAKVAIEWDSRSWHVQQSAMSNDRRRDRLAAAHGWVVLRFTWDDIVERPEQVVRDVAAVLERRLTSTAGVHGATRAG